MQRYFVTEKINNQFILSNQDKHHIQKVMRCKNNDNIEVVYDNKVYLCTIIDIESLQLKIEKEYTEDKEIPVKLTIGISLVQEQKMDLILQKLTELGVYKIIPIDMERSIVRLDESKKQKKLQRWQMICKEASEQSHRTSIPIVTEIKKITDLKEEKQDLKLICSLNEGTNPLEMYLNKDVKEVLFIIGPEGGITEKEENILIDNGFRRTTLGKRVLRVETAAIYVSSIINYVYKG